MSKKLRVLILIPVVLVLLLGILVSREWEAPKLGRAVLARAAALGGVELDVSSVHFHVLKGIRLEQVRARLASPGGNVVAEMDRLELRHRLGPLLSGRVEIDELRLVRPEVQLLAPDAAAPPGAAAGTGGGPTPAALETPAGGAQPEGKRLAISVASIVIDDGTFVLESAEEGVAPTRLEGLDLELRDLTLDPTDATAIVGLRGAGRLEAESIEADPLFGSDLRSDLAIGDGKVTLGALELEAKEGPIAAEVLVLDLTREPWVFEVRAGRVVPIALAAMLGSTGESFGPAELGVDVTGDAETLGLDGGGRVSVAEGTLPAIPLLETLELLIGSRAISGSPYEAFELPFRLSGTRVDLEPTEILTPDLRIRIGGAADLAGTVDLRATLRFRREDFDVAEIPREILDLLTDAEGFVNLHAGLVGPMDAPEATLDRSAWKATAQDAVQRELQQGVEKEATKLLRGLLGGDDENDG